MSLIKLGIALNYPVEWDFERILRDLIQNFFDSIGWENFGKEFLYSYKLKKKKGYTVTMSTQGHPFSYEWLIYVGGSTKTSSSKIHIGKYGEGFKICMLGLWKMGIKNIYMHSAGWKIRPCVYEEKVEDSVVKMLGYQYKKAKDDGKTILVMRGVPRRFYYELSEALLHFFYRENPLFGERIAESEKCIIYRRNEMQIPCGEDLEEFRGILYCNYLARGRLSLPYFVLACGDFEDSDSRKREVLTDYDAWKILHSAIKDLDAAASYKILMDLKKYWNDKRGSRYEWRTWYYLICQLVRNTRKSEELVIKFREEYGNTLAYIDQKTFDRRKNKLIDETKLWASENNKKRLVNPIFRYLGAESLLEKYQQSQTITYETLNESQYKKIQFLCQVFHAVVPYTVNTDEIDFKISSENIKKLDPLQFSEKIYGRKKEKYRINKIVLNSEDFYEGAFQDTFIKVSDIFLHTYGSSRSARLNVLLTNFGKYIIEKRDLLKLAEKKWNTME